MLYFTKKETAFCTGFFDIDFSEVNPCLLQHHAGAGPQKVGMYIFS